MAKVLYVDDDLANLTVFEAICGDELEVLTSDSGARALELMAEEEVAVLLTDQRMPGMSGVELAEQARERFPDTIRILITAYSDIGEAIDAINRGQVRSYLRKPWDSDVLLATLREAVDLFGTRKKVAELERRMHETQRLYALGVVAAGLAHELRNPISVVSGSNDLIALRLLEAEEGRGPAQGWSDAQRAVLADIGEQVELSQAAVEQMLEICKGVELGNRRRDREQSCDLVEVVTLTLRAAYGTVKHRATVATDLEDGLPRVRGNRNQLAQVILNLILNAMQAFPDASEDNRVEVRVARSGDAVQVTIQDNGPGMPEEVRERIFHPFFTTKTDGGTGLGLAISKRIVEESGGRIEVESELGRGASFAVTLPVARRG